MSAGQFSDPLFRKGVVGAAVAVAVGLLAGFHSVVAGAVDKAVERRVASQSEAEAAARSARTAIALQALPNTALHGASFAPRTVSYRPSR